MPGFSINGRKIGPGCPYYIIAELSANHNQDYNSALELVRAAANAGSDAVKLQTYRPDTITIECSAEPFQIKGGLWDGQTLFELYKTAYTPWEWTKPLMEEANKLGMDLFSSPFDVTAVDFLESCDVPAYKIASPEITDHILISKIASTGKPVIISSGMATVTELSEAIDLLRSQGTKEICMLKCTSAYPAKIEDANVVTIKDMTDRYDVVGGLSDHTLGPNAVIASIIHGAYVIEKHFTLSRQSGSPDDAFSIEPHEWRAMVDQLRDIDKAHGSIAYGCEAESLSKKFRRSLFVVKAIKKGEIFTEAHVKSIRPSDGCHTKHYWDILGKAASCDIEYGTPMRLEYISS